MQREAQLRRQGSGAPVMSSEQRNGAALGKADDANALAVNARVVRQRLQRRKGVIQHFVVGHCRLVPHGVGHAATLEAVEHQGRDAELCDLACVGPLPLGNAAATVMHNHGRHPGRALRQVKVARDGHLFTPVLSGQ